MKTVSSADFSESCNRLPSAHLFYFYYRMTLLIVYIVSLDVCENNATSIDALTINDLAARLTRKFIAKMFHILCRYSIFTRFLVIKSGSDLNSMGSFLVLNFDRLFAHVLWEKMLPIGFQLFPQVFVAICEKYSVESKYYSLSEDSLFAILQSFHVCNNDDNIVPRFCRTPKNIVLLSIGCVVVLLQICNGFNHLL